MALFPRPTYSEILTRVQSDIDSRLEGVDSRLRRSVLNTIAYVVAGVTHGLYGFISYLALQIFPDTAEIEYLNRWGVIWGVERLQAIQATGNVTFTGTNGTVIPLGTELQRSDLTLFTTDAAVTIASGTATVKVSANDPGILSNTAVSSTLTFVSPIAGVNSEALVATGGLIGGLDIEDDDSYLERILLRIQQPPQGGSAQDYALWAKEVPGVTNVWVYPLEDGPGTVIVRIMAYDSFADGIPDSTLITDTQNHIDLKKPVTATVSVEAPTGVDLDFTIHLILNPGFVEADVKDDVEAALKDMLRRDASPGGTIYRNRIIEEIGLVPGVFSSVLTAPAANVTVAANEISIMGDITWT